MGSTGATPPRPFKPRKRFGQHFLHDPAVIARIVAAVAPRPGQRLVEIGPGRGALTIPLLQCSGQLDVVEIDRDLAADLQAMGHDRRSLRVHRADALTFSFCGLAGAKGKVRVVGNLPYNVSTPLLFHLLEQADCIDDMVFMLQKEIAERMSAPPGSRTYSRLSVMVQYRCVVEKLFQVGRGAFSPPPQVESTVLRLTPSIRPAGETADDPPRFTEVVNRAFMSRRKTMRNALRGMATEEDFAAAGIDPQRRAETLSVGDFVRLVNRISAGVR